MSVKVMAGFVILSLIGAMSLVAQEPPMATQPTKEHQWLQKFVGEWATQSKAEMGPGQPAMECSGTISSRSLGGNWVLNDLKGEWMGVTMLGVQTLGYDVTKKKYVGTWVDSSNAMMWQYVGEVDSTGKILTLEADGPNMMEPGKMTKFQDIYEFKSADEILMTSKMLSSDGKWVSFMTGTAKRVKK